MGKVEELLRELRNQIKNAKKHCRAIESEIGKCGRVVRKLKEFDDKQLEFKFE